MPDAFEFDKVNQVIVATPTQRELTSPNTAELVEELTNRMRFDNVVLFVLDMRHVEFVSSACIGPLVGFLQDLEHVRGRVVLAGCQPNVQFLFKVTKLDTVFPLFDDREEACREITGA